MKYLKAGAPAIAGIGAILLFAWRVSPVRAKQEAPSRSAQVASRSGTTIQPSSGSSQSGTLGASQAVPRIPDKAASAAASYTVALKASRDYWSLAKETLERAKAGDASAQFLIWRIYRECHNGLAGLIKPNDSLDRALGITGSFKPDVSLDRLLTITRPFHADPDEVTLAFNRCHKFYSDDASVFGNPTDWLVRAAKAGNPMAQAEAAEKILVQQEWPNIAIIPLDLPEPPIEDDMDPRVYWLAPSLVMTQMCSWRSASCNTCWTQRGLVRTYRLTMTPGLFWRAFEVRTAPR
jgi:hypothetical protein